MTTEAINVIVADDNEFDRYVAKRVLAKVDRIGAVGECVDGAELVDIVRSSVFESEWGPHPPPVLVLLDINMPRMNGFDVLAELSAVKGTTATDSDASPRVSIDEACIVLMLTSSVSLRDREQASNYDLVAGYIEKPIDSAKLARALAEIYPTFTGSDDAN